MAESLSVEPKAELGYDCFCTEEIMCPHCGHEHDPTDYLSDAFYRGTEDCDKCGKKFRFEADFEITWVTEKE